MEGEDDDLEMLRQAALKTLGTNRNRSKGTSNQARVNAPQRIKTNGNLIEIQPTDMVHDDTIDNPEDYIVEEFVLEGSDVSINSSDCDEVIEEMIVSDEEDMGDDDALDGQQVEGGVDDSQNALNAGEQQRTNLSRSGSSHHNSSDDESDAVSIKSSYSLILDDDDSEYQSLESKFLSKKVQRQKGADISETLQANDASTGFRRRRSRSPAPFRTTRPGRRSRSKSRDRDRGARSRSPLNLLSAGRRNQSPPRNMRGGRRPIRTNSNERRRRRTRSRSPITRSPPQPNRNRVGVPTSRHPKSRSHSHSPPADNKSKQVSNSHTRAKSPVADKMPEKLEKTIKNNNIPPEEMERLEKRRRKFEGESEVVAHSRKVIKIASSSKSDKRFPSTSQITTKQPEASHTGKSRQTVLKEKVQKASSKRSVEVDEGPRETEPVTKKKEGRKDKPPIDGEEEKSSSTGEDQEDLRTRLIKKKLEKMQQTGETSRSTGSNSRREESSGASGPVSAVVVVNVASHRLFSQALKNSQLLDSEANHSVKGKGVSNKRERSPSSRTNTSKSPRAVKSEVKISSGISKDSSSSNRKKTSGSSSSRGESGGTTGSSSSSGKSKSRSGPKRVVSLTYS